MNYESAMALARGEWPAEAYLIQYALTKGDLSHLDAEVLSSP